MRFGVKDRLVEAKRIWWGEQQEEIFESLREEKALHGVSLFFGDDTLECGIAFTGAAVLNQVFEHRFALPKITFR